jgi:4-hydroxy-tetrahydrodipicolinate reductase
MRIALVGYGRMGRAVETQALKRDHQIAVRLGREALEAGTERVADALAGSDVAIDFTVGSAVPDIVRAAASAGVSLASGTTGLTAEAHQAMHAATGIGIVHGPNFSVGVHVYFRLAREAARLMGVVGDYDVHVHEAHHRHKRDHPSGTAIRLADLLVEELGDKHRWRAGAPDGAAEDGTLYVTSTRAGKIPGTHTAGFEGPHDGIELTHRAHGREGFASGAVLAAEWIHGQTGVFTFAEVMDRILNDEVETHGK